MTANHQKDGLPHQCDKRCSYNKELDNEVWKCLACHREGHDMTVYGKLITKDDGLFQGLVRYMWSGFVIECVHHGEIYRSRKYWYGNNQPQDVTRVEVVHVWPGDKSTRLASDVTPRKIVDAIRSAGRFVPSLERIVLGFGVNMSLVGSPLRRRYWQKWSRIRWLRRTGFRTKMWKWVIGKYRWIDTECSDFVEMFIVWPWFCLTVLQTSLSRYVEMFFTSLSYSATEFRGLAVPYPYTVWRTLLCLSSMWPCFLWYVHSAASYRTIARKQWPWTCLWFLLQEPGIGIPRTDQSP